MPRQYRWVCPVCGRGALGPKAPRRDATVRYCLPCSGKSTTLVARTCPVLDKVRETKAERIRAKAKRKTTARQARKQASARAREHRAAALNDRVGDLHAELARIWPTALELSKRETMPRRLPGLVVRNRSDEHMSGRAWPWQHRIVVSVGVTCDRASAVGTLAHEVAHLMTPDDEPSHGRAFWVLLVELCALMHGTAITISDVDGESTKYAKQVAIEASIRAAMK